jgi:hypothetical protein
VASEGHRTRLYKPFSDACVTAAGRAHLPIFANQVASGALANVVGVAEHSEHRAAHQHPTKLLPADSHPPRTTTNGERAGSGATGTRRGSREDRGTRGRASGPAPESVAVRRQSRCRVPGLSYGPGDEAQAEGRASRVSERPTVLVPHDGARRLGERPNLTFANRGPIVGAQRKCPGSAGTLRGRQQEVES